MEKSLDGITMGDIAERAEVNRATVYLHYKDREDLLLEASESTMAGILDAASACRLTADTSFAFEEPAPAHLVNLFTHVDQHHSLYSHLLGEDGSPRFAAHLERLLAQGWYEQLVADADPEKTDEIALSLRAHFLSGALLSVIARWTQGEFADTDAAAHNSAASDIEHVAQVTWSLIRSQICVREQL